MSEKTASFAAGCFWGVEARFRQLNGVIDAAVGYMGGNTDNPGYQQVCSGSTGHAEAVQLLFDDTKVSYVELLDAFFAMHNPTTLNRQGADSGSQYRSVVFCHSEDQENTARQAIVEIIVLLGHILPAIVRVGDHLSPVLVSVGLGREPLPCLLEDGDALGVPHGVGVHAVDDPLHDGSVPLAEDRLRAGLAQGRRCLEFGKSAFEIHVYLTGL